MERLTIDERLEEIRKRIAQAIACDRMDEAEEIYKKEFLDAEAAKERLWECR